MSRIYNLTGVQEMFSVDSKKYFENQTPRQNMQPSSLILYRRNVIRSLTPNNVDLPNEHRQSNHHRDGNNRQIDTRKLQSTNTNMLPRQNIAPQHTRQRRAERQAESAVVDTNGHAVHCAPERAIGNWYAILIVNFLPCLNDTGDEYRGANVCAGELFGLVNSNRDKAGCE